MKKASPWWLWLAAVGGLILIFLGQRAFKSESFAPVMTAAGSLACVGVLVYKVMTRSKFDRPILACYAGIGLALLVYFLTTSFGMKLLGLGGLSDAAAAKYRTIMMVGWALLLLVSAVPLALMEISKIDYALRVASRNTLAGKMTADERTKFTEHEEDIESVRVRDAGWSGLSIALLAGLLLVTCQVASEKNVRRDVSYFKTSAPGEAAQKIARASTEKIKVLLFFPPVNAVKTEVKGYFESLAADTGKVEIQEIDFMSSPKLATRYGISKHGVILIAKGDLFLDDADTKKKAPNERIDLETDIEKVRRGKNNKLRNLDRDVNTALMKLARDKRKAYITVGHGELNDYESVRPEQKSSVPERRTTFLKRRLGELNYELKEVGLVDLIQGVPDDAAMVIMLAPSEPLTPEELAALDRYVEKGGRMLIALDPHGNGMLGPLEGRLGVKLNKAPITDDKYMYRQRGTLDDRRWAVTTQFSAHASTTTLSRSVDKGLLLVESGALEDSPFTRDADKTKRTYVIRSMTSSWLDLDDDFTFDDGLEKRDRYNVGAAIEGPKVKAADGTDKDGFRAMVFADADLFADLAAVNLGNYAVLTVGPVPAGYMSQPLGLTSGPLLDDAVKWLGGEEVLAGEVVSEDDVPIKHTQDKDTAWFLGMIGGAPLIVVGFGAWFVTRRKRKAQGPRPAAPAEVKP